MRGGVLLQKRRKTAVRAGVAGALCTLLAVPALASELPDGGEDNQPLKLTYQVDSDFEVIIPEQVSLDQNLEIAASVANMEPGMAVKVRIAQGLTNGNVTLDRDQDDSDYAIQVPVRLLSDSQATLTSSTVIAAFQDIHLDAFQEEPQKIIGATLTFGTPVTPDGKEVKAGFYTGSMTFAISYEEYEEGGQ